MNRTPSPLTPSFDFNALEQHKVDTVFAPQHAFFSPPRDQQQQQQQQQQHLHHHLLHQQQQQQQQHQHQPVSTYPPIPQQGPFNSYPAPPQLAPQPQQLYQGPLPPSDIDANPIHNPNASADANANPHHGDSRPQPPSKAPKKNQYPCPLAKQFNCHDFFTTSGHAARHAKKHTGKKDAFCPECNKAFTRKDNMEQHRRTHQNGRNSNKGAGESQPKRVKTSTQPRRASKPPPLPAAAPALDPSLPQSPASSFGYPEPTFAQPVQTSAQAYPLDLLQASPFAQNTPYHLSGPYDPALAMTGLDTLAIAAAKRDADF